MNIISVRNDHRENQKMNHSKIFIDENRISNNFSYPRTPQQNEVLERKIEHCKKWVNTFK